MTPEGRVKKAVNKLLDQYPRIYRFMPVPSGYGKSSLDYLLCVDGLFVTIETKAPRKEPTPRQWEAIAEIERAGGAVFIIDDVSKTKELEEFLDRHATRSSISKTQNRRSATRARR